MGGMGSGRRVRQAIRSNALLRLDLSVFRRELLGRCWKGKLHWSAGGERLASLEYLLSERDVRLAYPLGSDETTECFEFAYSEQHFGGSRRWIICKCRRRCRVLYGGLRFRCRECYRLCFASQYERFRVPGMAKAEKVRDKYGMEAGFANPFGDRPKGMHWKTYYRLRENDWAMSEAIDLALAKPF